ncbi:helix-turn-helix transcriptional regulator [Mycobacterium sp. 852002-51057_SCH5723018]|uniref:ArsR/SmtB family transcription factor n=1 Tax=Mycobacterium sp. 852002-51057_SCH5723018 TaxID=1834094 RepID=UPI000800C3CE|nr:metalloregulator ArsR/SmtB family transcription factor [Mycobacterium sp. 852002-51057_SCH5723018]OBG30495.1 transcriptional regulator [Mycobacterium sp. 852002-51057_SCH5723018]
MSNQAQRCCPALGTAAMGESQAAELAAMFKALGDPVRLRLLSLIASHPGGEACVCEISATFDVSQPTISHHLKLLRSAGLLDCERRGTWVYYWVIPSALQQLSSVLHIDDLVGATRPGCGP